jgi:phage gp29-like protein
MAAREQYNPLRSLTIARAVSLLEAGQRGEYADLMWTYWFVEQTEPILGTILERRSSALMDMDWAIKTIPRQRRRRNFDQGLADEQAAALAEMYDRIDNLKEGIEHLALASFRMFAHLNIQRDAAGEVAHLEPLDQWNFVRDGMFGDWYWNPEARQVGVRSLPPENRIVPEDFIVRTVARHVNRPALIKYIRKNLGEKNWSSYVEIYGIPPVIIIMPPNVAKGREAEYEQAAADVASGGRGTLPNGTQVEFAGEARGSQPFKEYCDWIDGQMVMLGTGGLLTVLSMPQGMGSGSSGEHGDAFRQLARAESYRISEIFQRQLDKATLARLFPGKPVLAYFEIAARAQNDPSKILTDAGLAKNAGFAMDADELSERTGYTLTEAAAPVPPPPMPPDAGGAALNSVPRRSSQAEAGAPPASPMEPILVELEGLLDDGDPDAIEAWIKTLPKKAAALDVGAVADPLARRMEAAAVAELEGRMKDLGKKKT